MQCTQKADGYLRSYGTSGACLMFPFSRLVLTASNCTVPTVSRSILSLMRDDGEQLGRFKVRSLMRVLDLVSKQPGSHAYNRATVERLDIPNTLNREFDVPHLTRCGAAPSPTFGPKENGIIWLSCWIFARVG
jgi:hypothetical protein